MKSITFLTALSVCALTSAQNISKKHQAHLDSLIGAKKELTYSDLMHENPGCPENSICSKAMGEKIKRWEDFLSALKAKRTTNNSQLTNAARLEKFRKEHGIPVMFLANKDSVLSLDPLLYNSRCEIHNPKDKSKTIFKAMQFFRNDPESKSAQLDPVSAYPLPTSKQAEKKSGIIKKVKNQKEISYRIPYQESPIMIQNGALILAREYNDFFYYVSFAENGKWKVVSPKQELISKALQSMENIPCPKESYAESYTDSTGPNKNYLKSFCKKIYNADTKTMSGVRMPWSCP